MTALLLAIIYLAAIGVGLADPILGSAWPSMHTEMGVPISWSGGIFMLIAAGTIIGGLISDRMIRKIGAGRFTAMGMAISSVALFGFSASHSYGLLCLLAIPYGFGIGSTDAALNNYVVHRFPSSFTSWLHCIWGVGATAGTYIMSRALELSTSWNTGYRWIGFIQVAITCILLLSLPLWKRNTAAEPGHEDHSEKIPAMPLAGILALPGVKAMMICCFCYCAIEQCVSLWASSFLVNCKGLNEPMAARIAGLFFLGITVGRGISGFVSFRLSDRQMIKLGFAIIAAGIIAIILPLGNIAAFIGLIIVGLGCAPIFPCLLHSSPGVFGEERSKAIVGVLMASAYTGTALMPPLFGVIGGHVSLKLFPYFLLLVLAGMVIAFGWLHSKLKTES